MPWRPGQCARSALRKRRWASAGAAFRCAWQPRRYSYRLSPLGLPSLKRSHAFRCARQPRITSALGFAVGLARAEAIACVDAAAFGANFERQEREREGVVWAPLRHEARTVAATPAWRGACAWALPGTPCIRSAGLRLAGPLARFWERQRAPGEYVRALGSVQEPLGPPWERVGSAPERLGASWERWRASGSAWGAPGRTWERRAEPRRVARELPGAPENAWGAPANAWGRFGAPESV